MANVGTPIIAFDYKISRYKKSDGFRSTSKSNATVAVTVASDAVSWTHERMFDGCETVHSARRMMSFEMLDWVKKHRIALANGYLFAATTTLKGAEDDLAGTVQFVSVDGHMSAFTVTVSGSATVQAAEDAAAMVLNAVLEHAEQYFAGCR